MAFSFSSLGALFSFPNTEANNATDQRNEGKRKCNMMQAMQKHRRETLGRDSDPGPVGGESSFRPEQGRAIVRTDGCRDSGHFSAALLPGGLQTGPGWHRGHMEFFPGPAEFGAGYGHTVAIDYYLENGSSIVTANRTIPAGDSILVSLEDVNELPAGKVAAAIMGDQPLAGANWVRRMANNVGSQGIYNAVGVEQMATTVYVPWISLARDRAKDRQPGDRESRCHPASPGAAELLQRQRHAGSPAHDITGLRPVVALVPQFGPGRVARRFQRFYDCGKPCGRTTPQPYRRGG